ncbi:hypothetical protein DRW07_12390 [Alteromonas sediminis]|uniref:Uncharacterized protein n=1 Tax=Alteromonas sediminis TaxID=2259342 RepID=A0A3N5Z924_9ALTE|nr:hypothetical protein [Alteromonas sediminis]RPJ65618.1 hypothetical protein DRW07_12390 [Alteromonas sediminis]
MSKQQRGFSLLALSLVIISVGLFFCSLVAMQAYMDKQNYVVNQHYHGATTALDKRMKEQLAKLFIDKATVTATEEAAVPYTYLSAVEYEPLSAHLYEGVYRVKASVRKTKSLNTWLSQEVLVGRFKFADKLLLASVTHLNNDDLHQVLLHKLSLTYDLQSYLVKFADSTFESCNTFPKDVHGIVVIKGDCSLNNVKLGKNNRPLFLIIIDGDLKFGSNTHFIGLVLHLCFNGEPHVISSDSQYALQGALATSCNTQVGTALVKPEPNIVKMLHDHPDNQKLEIITGSWKFN